MSDDSLRDRMETLASGLAVPPEEGEGRPRSSRRSRVIGAVAKTGQDFKGHWLKDPRSAVPIAWIKSGGVVLPHFRGVSEPVPYTLACDSCGAFARGVPIGKVHRTYKVSWRPRKVTTVTTDCGQWRPIDGRDVPDLPDSGWQE